MLILECDNIENAIIIMNKFPLVSNNLIGYRITCLLPYNGFERLLNGTDK